MFAGVLAMALGQLELYGGTDLRDGYSGDFLSMHENIAIMVWYRLGRRDKSESTLA
jgi:hypothetical protein